MNIFDLIIIIALALAVFLAIRQIRKRRNKGCSGFCSGCDRECSFSKKK